MDAMKDYCEVFSPVVEYFRVSKLSLSEFVEKIQNGSTT